MVEINWISIFIAAALTTGFSYLWFEKIPFGRMLKSDKSHLTDLNAILMRYGLVLMIQIIVAFLMSILLLQGEYSGMADGIKFGFVIAFGFFGTYLAIIYWISNKPKNVWSSMLIFVAISAMLTGALVASSS